MRGFRHTVLAVCVSLVLSGLTPTVVSAGARVSLHNPAAKVRFRATVEMDGSTSLGGDFLNLGVRGVYQPRLWGAGLELRFPWSASRGDSYALLSAMVLLGWFDLGVGASVMMTAPRPSSYVVSSGILPSATMGMLIPGFKVGPGRLGLNASLDFFITAFPMSLGASAFSYALTHPGPSLGSQVFGPGMAAVLAEATALVKLTVGLNYSFGL